ncbi:MAG TPA: hypothetical protein DCR24_02970 [Bacillus bacterium]|nr:hypothetical protein [Bacillus sp. (in: firmicutes)]
MNISMQKLLFKMEEELSLAKQADNVSAQRERIHSIKTLCELVLDEPVTQVGGKQEYRSEESRRLQQGGPQYFPVQPPYQQPQIPLQQTSPLMPQPKKLETDDQANGDSLFDF